MLFPSSRIFRLLFAILAGGLLGACTTEATRRSDAVTRSNAAATELLHNCVQSTYNLPAFEPARRHLPADMSQSTLEQETDPSMAKDVEIVAVVQVHPQLHECRKAFLDKMTASNPSLVPIYALVFTLSENILIEVMQKQRNWGDYVHDVKVLEKKADTEIENETKNIADGLSHDAKAEQTRKDTAEKAVALYMQTQKVFNSMRRPVLVKCDPNGPSVNCVNQ
jgi:hypothetical protein